MLFLVEEIDQNGHETLSSVKQIMKSFIRPFNKNIVKKSRDEN